MSSLTNDQFEQILELTNAVLKRTRQTDPAIKPTDFFSGGWLLNFWLHLTSQANRTSGIISLLLESKWMTEVGLRSKFRR